MAETNKQKVRVLFLNTRDRLGADVAVHVMLARALDRTAVDVWAATSTYEAPGASTHAQLERIPDLRLLPIELGQPLSDRHGVARALALARNMQGIFSLAQLAWLCRRERVDIIHVTERPRDALFGLLLARAAGAACLIHAHTSYYAHNASRLDNWMLRRADALVGVSRFTAQTYIRDAHVPESRVFAVHNAADPVQFAPMSADAAGGAHPPDALRARYGIPADAPLIGCVARLSRWKGQGELLEAFAQVRRGVPDAHLLLAGLNSDGAPDGQGSYEGYLRRRINALGLADAVTFAGFVGYEEMPALFQALDVLAHPAWEEPFGLVLVEAMACERAVVAVGAGGIVEIIRDGEDGLLVPREEPAGLAAALLRTLRDPVLRERLGRSGRERVLRLFTPELQGAAMLAVYRRIVARRGVRAATPAADEWLDVSERAVPAPTQLSVAAGGGTSPVSQHT